MPNKVTDNFSICFNIRMEGENNIKIDSLIDPIIVDGLFDFFDLLARFDYEDKQKEKLVLNSDSLVSAPRVSEFGPNSKE